MPKERSYDAIVVGSGPNGLAAAIELARAGKSVAVLEAADTPGGGCRTAELTLRDFHHDVCSAIHPLAVASPFFRSLPLANLGVKPIEPPVQLAHPLDDGSAVLLYRSIDTTAESLGGDGRAYRRLMRPLVDHADVLMSQILGPLRLPRHPVKLAAFGVRAIRSAEGLARSHFEEPRARALIAGISAHSMLPLDRTPTAAYGLMLAAVGHAVGWPLIEGGSQRITRALVAHLESLGGEVITGWPVKSLTELPQTSAVLFDLTPRQVLAIAGDALPGLYRRKLSRYRYGPGVCKVDFALSEPIPWKAEGLGDAATVHLGGTLEEIAASEAAANAGRHHDRPYVLLAQQSLFDGSRAPAGKHTAWAYCHVPSGSERDMTEVIEGQIERFAPGFREIVLARSVLSAKAIETYNANYIGGDINGGVEDLRQLFTRPVARLNPYTTPNKSLYLCSSSTPPGGGVHGMCGHWAAKAALKRAF